MKSTNPFSLKLIKEYDEDNLQSALEKLDLLNLSFISYRKTSIDQRLEKINNLKAILIAEKNELAQMITDEMGKVISESLTEINKCIFLCDYYLQNTEIFLTKRVVNSSFKQAHITYEPLGVILGIMPWNFPFWQVLRFAVPTIIAGNTIMLKHASNVSGCALKIEEIFQKAGFNQNQFKTILLNSKYIHELILDSKVKGVSLTGSTPAGLSVAKSCAKQLKPYVLELGGSDPYVVFKDANLKEAAKSLTNARLINNGQSCIAGKRFIIEESIFTEFSELLKNEFKKYQFGAPNDLKTNLSVLAKEEYRDDINNFVKDALKQGAEIIYQADEKDHPCYYPATILKINNLKSSITQEEIFGPVAQMMSFQTKEEAIKLCNSTSFALGAAIFTSDNDTAQLMSSEVVCGQVFINDFVKSDPHLPFGGLKLSGIGRELSKEGLLEFVNIKTIVKN